MEPEPNNLLPSGLLDDSDSERDGSDDRHSEPNLVAATIRSLRSASISISSEAKETCGRPIVGRSYDSSTFRMQLPPSSPPTEPPGSPVLAQRTAVVAPLRAPSGNQQPLDCVYCRNSDRPSQGHSREHCPVLAHMAPCIHCQASGVNNHTPTHCPRRPKTTLSLRPEFSPRKNGGAGGSH
uniref:Nanos-type domain-containing protein n=1 Tax=Plectus sambesii TaxID=2011161 RepID=A0A914WQS5_9BILA